RLSLTTASSFFSQAEDGIRDFHVTGVQTCALPISAEHGLALLLDVRAPAFDHHLVAALGRRAPQHRTDAGLLVLPGGGDHRGAMIGRAARRVSAMLGGVARDFSD